MTYIRTHQDILRKLVDLIGITSIMEVLIRLIGADEHIYNNYADVMQWLEETDVLELIVDKFSSSDCPEMHANAAESLCALTQYASSGITSKISSPSFIGRLFHHALADGRPRSVLVNSLSVCISLLDPKRLTSSTYYMFNCQMTHGSGMTANPSIVEGIIESLGELLKLLDVSSEEHVLLTSYGKLQPPLGTHRLKIIEFISVLVTINSEAAEKELILLGAVKLITELFFEYPYNNFLHHHVEQIIVSCLENKNAEFVEHLLRESDLVGKFLEAEKNNTLATDPKNQTVPAEGKSPPRLGNIGHITRIANKLVQLGDKNSDLQAYLQENSGWIDWHTNELPKRNAMENVHQWACGRPTSLQDRTRDSDDDDYQDRDYDVAALANNLSQAFRYSIQSNDDLEEVHGSLERDDKDAYFDDESAEVVISSVHLGDDQESWFAFEENTITDRSDGSVALPSPNIEGISVGSSAADDLCEDDLRDTTTNEMAGANPSSKDDDLSNFSRETETKDSDKPPEWVEWREGSDLIQSSGPTPDAVCAPDTVKPPSLPNGDIQVEFEALPGEAGPNTPDDTPSSAGGSRVTEKGEGRESQELSDACWRFCSQLSGSGIVDPSTSKDDSLDTNNHLFV